MYIGDLVEMIAYIKKRYGGFEQMDRKRMRRLSGAKYIWEQKLQRQSYNDWVTNLLE